MEDGSPPHVTKMSEDHEAGVFEGVPPSEVDHEVGSEVDAAVAVVVHHLFTKQNFNVHVVSCHSMSMMEAQVT